MIGAQWVLGTFMALAHPDMASSAGPLGARKQRSHGCRQRHPARHRLGRAVEEVLVITPGSHGPCAVQEGTNLAGEPRDDLVLVDVEVPAERTRR